MVAFIIIITLVKMQTISIKHPVDNSETTLAVGIAQLTHPEVRGRGKNPGTGDQGIFSPTVDRVGSYLHNTDRHVIVLLSHNLYA